MRLKIIESSSLGNSYLLVNGTETLMIECGVNISTIKKALNYDVSRVVGCCISHEHLDHSKAIHAVMKTGIDVYASRGTLEAMGAKGHRAKIVEPKKVYRIGEFKVMPFDVEHDCAEPLGFIIEHHEMGRCLFATDTYYLKYKFPELNNIIIEANYAQDILNLNTESGRLHPSVRGRVLSSHMDLASLKDILKVNDISMVNKIVLIHLSDGNSHAQKFVDEIHELTGKDVYAADAGMNLEFNQHPFLI